MQEQELVNAIAKLVVEQLKNVDVCDPKDRIPVGISARHVHLSQADLETLFGKGYELHKKKDLMGGQYAAQECVTIIGTKLRAIENVRVLGPVRKPDTGGGFCDGCSETGSESSGSSVRRSGRLRTGALWWDRKAPSI